MAFWNNCNHYNVIRKYHCSQPTFVIEGNAKFQLVGKKTDIFSFQVHGPPEFPPWILRTPAYTLFIFNENLVWITKTQVVQKINYEGIWEKKWRSDILVELVGRLCSTFWYTFFYVPLLPAGISIVLFNEPLMNSLTSMA